MLPEEWIRQLNAIKRPTTQKEREHVRALYYTYDERSNFPSRHMPQIKHLVDFRLEDALLAALAPEIPESVKYARPGFVLVFLNDGIGEGLRPQDIQTKIAHYVTVDAVDAYMREYHSDDLNPNITHICEFSWDMRRFSRAHPTEDARMRQRAALDAVAAPGTFKDRRTTDSNHGDVNEPER